MMTLNLLINIRAACNRSLISAEFLWGAMPCFPPKNRLITPWIYFQLHACWIAQSSLILTPHPAPIHPNPKHCSLVVEHLLGLQNVPGSIPDTSLIQRFPDVKKGAITFHGHGTCLYNTPNKIM